MREGSLSPVYQRYQLTPVVLVVVDEWAKPLIDVFVYDLRLTVGLLVICGRELDLYSDDPTKLVLE